MTSTSDEEIEPTTADEADRTLVGRSTKWLAALDLVDRVAPSSATVLLTGESGTGKEVVARAIHERSRRRDGPFVPVHCAALPSTLLEAELFGHEKGAFTGAAHRRKGRFEEAHGGTLFLDEVAEIPPEIQVKLLRAIQERRVERLGGQSPRDVDIRLVAATNKDLRQEIAAGRFREDLYYRLKVIEIALPALRERAGDIPLLADRFLHRFARKNEKQVDAFHDEARELLQRYPWPGNVRELENVVERAVVLARGRTVRGQDLPTEVRDCRPELAPGHAHASQGGYLIPADAPLAVAERIVIEGALRRAAGDKDRAAKLLGIGARTIYRRLREWSRT